MVCEVSFDNIELVIKVIKQLSFCSIITSENYEGGFKACTDNVDPGVGPKFDNSKCVIKVIKPLTFCSGITSANFDGGGVRQIPLFFLFLLTLPKLSV